ncbi:hypothetical protein EV426DRAFT_709618 [Tirmania nivea]|nr:hypothetical protein EV426DRAFT_709618 [Tirmania nivea]
MTAVNEKADGKAEKTVWAGRRMLSPDIATPAGIRQAYPMLTLGIGVDPTWHGSNNVIRAYKEQDDLI